MTRIKSSLFLAGLLALGLPMGPAHAQLARTFVSAASGNDANDCNRGTPCRTFQGAHDKTLANGEITVLDPGGYGAVQITKAISIINDGVGEAGVLVSGGTNGITVNAAATDAVSLRGLTIKGIGFGGGNGIVFNRGKSLTIENCVVRGLTGVFPAGFGIRLLPITASSFAVSNTLVADNLNGGISLQPLAAGPSIGSATAVFNRIEAYNNSSGLVVFGSSTTGPVTATVTDSVAAGNLGAGFFAASSLGRTRLTVTGSVAANNATGVAASGANATLRVGQSVISGNGAGLQASDGGTLASYGDNNINGNGTGTETPPSTIAKQ